MCPACYQDGGSLLHCLSTLTSASEAVYFCCTGLGVTSTGRYPASCPAKPGLSSSEPFRLFSRDYLAWLRKCYSSTFFCTCKEISFITVHSVLSNVAKIHFKLPAAMDFKFWHIHAKTPRGINRFRNLYQLCELHRSKSGQHLPRLAAEQNIQRIRILRDWYSSLRNVRPSILSQTKAASDKFS